MHYEKLLGLHINQETVQEFNQGWSSTQLKCSFSTVNIHDFFMCAILSLSLTQFIRASTFAVKRTYCPCPSQDKHLVLQAAANTTFFNEMMNRFHFLMKSAHHPPISCLYTIKEENV